MLLWIASFFVILVGCGENQPVKQQGEAGQEQPKNAAGGRVYGGTLHLAHHDEVVSLYPPRVLDLMSANIAGQVFEGLVQFDPRTLEIRPRIAKSWSLSEDGRTYRFTLHKGIYFHDDPCFENGQGRELTANDIAWTFTQVCTPGPDNLVFAYTLKDRLLGASEYYNAAESGQAPDGVEGIRVVDPYTIELVLEAPSNSFLYTLAQVGLSILPREGVEKYSNKLRIGSGPFVLARPTEGCICLLRNQRYYGADTLGNQLPFLDSVIISAMTTKSEELAAFEAGDLDAVSGLPAQLVPGLVEQNLEAFQGPHALWNLDPSPELSTDYYQFNMTRAALKDVRVRKAIAYAIDRVKIIDDVLKGSAYAPGIYGICPPSFTGYKTSKLEGYTHDPKKARKLLAEAGYPNGKGFPSLTLEVNKGGLNAQVAFEVQQQLRQTLGINLELEVSTMADKLEHDRFALADISRKAWIADFPSPESFLYLFHGASVPGSLVQPSFPNTARYQNASFDKLYEEAVIEQNTEKSYELFMQAEQQMLNDAPIVVLWYNEAHKLKNRSVQHFFSNPLNCWDLSRVYLQPGKPTAVAAQVGK